MIVGLPARQLFTVVSPRPVDPTPDGSPVGAQRDGGAPAEHARSEKPRARATQAGATPAKPARAAVPPPVRVAPMPPRRVASPLVVAETQGGTVPHTHVTPSLRPDSAPLERVEAPAPRVESAPLPPRTAPGTSPSVPVVTAQREEESPWIVYAVAAFGILLLGAAGGGLLLARRWPPVAPTDPVEAELQEMISERRAREEEPIRDR